MHLEKNFQRDAKLFDQYSKTIKEYLSLGQMEELFLSEKEVPCLRSYYIPHHAVNKEGAKFRVVFDASCRSESGISLNDLMMTGPNLQSDLCVILNSWRC